MRAPLSLSKDACQSVPPTARTGPARSDGQSLRACVAAFPAGIVRFLPPLPVSVTLAIMEGYATALSRESFTEKRIATLKELNQKMKETLTNFDFGEFGKLNREFHVLTYDQCPNKYLMETIQKTWIRMDSIRLSGSTFDPKRANNSIHEHDHIIKLLSEGAAF
ncbi:FCD domain-containing protein, partial [Herbaspirillum sp. VT-16-41]|uniref:FCD domain-containing protein n=1 Tax=Herbaspirillum sp. VT-16-41 TaxID=1953765 RepID=UPI001115AC76